MVAPSLPRRGLPAVTDRDCTRGSTRSRQRARSRAEFVVRRPGRGGQGPDDDHGTAGQHRQLGEPVPDQVPQPPAYPVADHRVADRAGDHEAHLGRRRAGRRRSPPSARCSTRVRLPARCPARMQRRNDSPEVSRAAAGNTVAGPTSSDGELVAALATARREDRAARAGTHPQAETVHLVAAAVVRLVRTLGHEHLLRGSRPSGAFGMVCGTPAGEACCWPGPARSGVREHGSTRRHGR